MKFKVNLKQFATFFIKCQPNTKQFGNRFVAYIRKRHFLVPALTSSVAVFSVAFCHEVNNLNGKPASRILKCSINTVIFAGYSTCI